MTTWPSRSNSRWGSAIGGSYGRSASSQVGGFELVVEVGGLADAGDAAVEHDRGVVGDAEHGAGELLDHEDRDAVSAIWATIS